MAHTTHPVTLHPDTRGDVSWRSLAEQLGFHSVSDLCTWLDLTSDEAPADQRDVVPVDLEDSARLSVDIARAFIEAREL